MLDTVNDLARPFQYIEHVANISVIMTSSKEYTSMTSSMGLVGWTALDVSAPPNSRPIRGLDSLHTPINKPYSVTWFAEGVDNPRLHAAPSPLVGFWCSDSWLVRGLWSTIIPKYLLLVGTFYWDWNYILITVVLGHRSNIMNPPGFDRVSSFILF